MIGSTKMASPKDEQKYDQLFKQLLKAFFGELLQLVAPTVASQLDASKAEYLDKETFTDLPKGKHRYMDLLAKVPLKKSKLGEATTELVLAHTEIEGDFGEPMDKRMWRYFMQLKLRHDLPVLPLVIYVNGGEANIQWRQYKDHTCGAEVSSFSYLSFGLSPSNAQEFLKKPGALTAALSVHMKRGKLSKAQLKIECLTKIAKAKLDEAKEFLAFNFVQTYLPLEQPEQDEYTKLLGKTPSQEAKKMELTWADQVQKKAYKEGKAEGKAEGKVEGKIETLLKILELRKLTISKTQQGTIRACADVAQLDLWLEKALTATSLEQIFTKAATKAKTPASKKR
jgi:hypothetical protein